MTTAPRHNALCGVKSPQPVLGLGSGCIGATRGRVNGHKQYAAISTGTAQSTPLSQVLIPRAFDFLFHAARYKVGYGGRAGAKSWNFGRALLLGAARTPLRILCAREFQTSIKDSVMALLKDQIHALKLAPFFRFGQSYIESKCGSEFIFKGLRLNVNEIKSLEGVDICWVEEAQRVSEASWVYLVPTIRKPGSEIWVSFNPDSADDPTYKRFVASPPPDALVRKVGWRDNPWFNATLNAERLYTLQTDADAYDWIWEGNCRSISDAVIFKGKFSMEAFETPADANFLHGADWGFGSDPTALVRSFIQGRTLFIDQESYAFGLDLDKIASTWRTAVPGCEQWMIYADNSQPQTIAHVRNFGMRIEGAQKWAGSVEDGIQFMRGFEKIVVHERCYYTGTEFRLYSYKTDKLTGDVQPVIQDKNNHCMDALRYALQKHIKCNDMGIWEKLGGKK